MPPQAVGEDFGSARKVRTADPTVEEVGERGLLDQPGQRRDVSGDRADQDFDQCDRDAESDAEQAGQQSHSHPCRGDPVIVHARLKPPWWPKHVEVVHMSVARQ